MRRALGLGLLLLLSLAPALARSLNLEIMPVGYVLSRDEVIDTLGRGVVQPGAANQAAGALRLRDMPATVKRREAPSYLLLSNAPEVLDGSTLPGRRGLLVSSEVPEGRIRVLVSHTNLLPYAQDFVLRMTNNSDSVADVTLEPRVAARQSLTPGTFSVDATVGGMLARSYTNAVRVGAPREWHPPDGDRHRIIQRGQSSDARLVTSVKGLGMAWLELSTNTTLQLSVFSVPTDGQIENPPAIARSGNQVRGLFTTPDQDVEATVDLTDGDIKRFVFGGAERNNAAGVLHGGSWMSGVDSTLPGQRDSVSNRGDFGGLTYFEAAVTAPPGSEYVGAMFVLVAGGRKAAVLPLKDGKPVVLNQWEGLILGRAAIGTTFKYEFTLPPNSWAPVYIMAVPLHHF